MPSSELPHHHHSPPLQENGLSGDRMPGALLHLPPLPARRDLNGLLTAVSPCGALPVLPAQPLLNQI